LLFDGVPRLGHLELDEVIDDHVPAHQLVDDDRFIFPLYFLLLEDRAVKVVGAVDLVLDITEDLVVDIEVVIENIKHVDVELMEQVDVLLDVYRAHDTEMVDHEREHLDPEADLQHRFHVNVQELQRFLLALHDR
jgi:hypothetical protein